MCREHLLCAQLRGCKALGLVRNRHIEDSTQGPGSGDSKSLGDRHPQRGGLRTLLRQTWLTSLTTQAGSPLLGLLGLVSRWLT